MLAPTYEKYVYKEQENLPNENGLNEHKFYFLTVYSTKDGTGWKKIISYTANYGIGFQFLPNDKIQFLFPKEAGYDLQETFKLSKHLLLVVKIFMEDEISDGLKATTNRRPTETSSRTSKATTTNKSK